MTNRIETFQDDSGRWRWMIDGGKLSSSEAFGTEEEARVQAESYLKPAAEEVPEEAAEAPPVAEGVAEGEVEVEKVERRRPRRTK